MDVMLFSDVFRIKVGKAPGERKFSICMGSDAQCALLAVERRRSRRILTMPVARTPTVACIKTTTLGFALARVC